METLWTIVALVFAIGVFAPIVVLTLALPLVLLAAAWMLTTRRRAE